MPARSRQRALRGLIALLACAVLAVHAQSPASNAVPPETPLVRQPSDAEIERAAREHRMPTDADLERTPIPSTPTRRHGPDRATRHRRSPDRSDRKPLRTWREQRAPRPAGFVTLGAQASLSALHPKPVRHECGVGAGAKTGQCARLGAARKLIGTQPVAWQIDPPAFAATALPPHQPSS